MTSMFDQWKRKRADRAEGGRLPIIRPGLITNAKEDLKSATDINGSYTGVPLDGGRPVQDADDL